MQTMENCLKSSEVSIPAIPSTNRLTITVLLFRKMGNIRAVALNATDITNIPLSIRSILRKSIVSFPPNKDQKLRPILDHLFRLVIKSRIPAAVPAKSAASNCPVWSGFRPSSISGFQVFFLSKIKVWLFHVIRFYLKSGMKTILVVIVLLMIHYVV